MGFNRDVIRRRRDQLHEWGVRMRWVGRAPRLWRSVIKELEVAQDLTQHNTGLTLYFCVNYGGRAEIADAVQRIAYDVKDGRLRPGSVDEKTIKRYLDEPTMPDVDLFVRCSGEQRTSNFLLWQSAYAEMVFQNQLWPDYDRRDLWAAIEEYVARDRRYGGAVDTPTPPPDRESTPSPLTRASERSVPEPTKCCFRSSAEAAGVLARLRPGSGGRGAAQSAQVPKISSVCVTPLKPWSRADRVGPPLDGRSLDLDGAPAGAAHEVVVVVRRAGPVDGLAVVGAQHVDRAGLDHRLERPVDRGQADACARVAQPGVHRLGGGEVVGALEQLGDGHLLPGGLREVAAESRAARHGLDPVVGPGAVPAGRALGLRCRVVVVHAVLVVVALVGGVQVPVVDVVDVVAVRHGRVAALGARARARGSRRRRAAPRRPGPARPVTTAVTTKSADGEQHDGAARGRVERVGRARTPPTDETRPKAMAQRIAAAERPRDQLARGVRARSSAR